jgi:hypothetical protein
LIYFAAPLDDVIVAEPDVANEKHSTLLEIFVDLRARRDLLSFVPFVFFVVH